MTNWKVVRSTKLDNEIKKLAKSIQAIAYALFSDLELSGPIQPEWSNYGPLNKSKKRIPPNSYHCHLKKGRPTFVACWRMVSKTEKIIEVFYVGTHEKAPYQ